MRELEAAIADMRTVTAQACTAADARRSCLQTMSAAARRVRSAQDRTAALDSTLGSLSVEQRIAVKSGMLRLGLL